MKHFKLNGITTGKGNPIWGPYTTKHYTCQDYEIDSSKNVTARIAKGGERVGRKVTVTLEDMERNGLQGVENALFKKLTKWRYK